LYPVEQIAAKLQLAFDQVAQHLAVDRCCDVMAVARQLAAQFEAVFDDPVVH